MEIVLITGGAGSGKTTKAIEIAASKNLLIGHIGAYRLPLKMEEYVLPRGVLIIDDIVVNSHAFSIILEFVEKRTFTYQIEGKIKHLTPEILILVSQCDISEYIPNVKHIKL